MYFGISPTAPLHEIFVSYASTQDIPLASLCWSFAGKVVGGDQTAADLGIEANGQLDFVELDLVAALTRSPPPGRLPPTGLQKVLEYFSVDDVHKAKPTSYCWREMGRFAIAQGRWEAVNWLAVYCKPFIVAASVGRCGPYGGVPASALPLFRAAWEVDPNETLRILFTPGPDYKLAARFLAIVEPSLDGLERILMRLEPAHRFIYAKHQVYRWRYGDYKAHLRKRIDPDTTIDVVRLWAAYIGTPMERTVSCGAPFDVPDLDILPVERRNLVVSYVSGALRSWADAAVAADFFFCFFCKGSSKVFDLGDFSRGWGERMASTFAAAYAADVAASRMRHPLAEGDVRPLFAEAEVE